MVPSPRRLASASPSGPHRSPANVVQRLDSRTSLRSSPWRAARRSALPESDRGISSAISSPLPPTAAFEDDDFALPYALSSERSASRSEEHTSELQSLAYLVCRLLLEKKKKKLTDES